MPHMTELQMLTRLGNQGLSIPSADHGASDARIIRQATELGVMNILQEPMSHHELLRFIECSMN